MQVLINTGILLAAYIFGSIPFGLLVVKLMTGKDIRTVASGRTGGTNAMRAAGPWAGVLTAILDIFKAAATVWLAQAVTPNVWIHTLAPIACRYRAQLFPLFDRTQPGRALSAAGWSGRRGRGRRCFWPVAPGGLLPDPARFPDLVPNRVCIRDHPEHRAD